MILDLKITVISGFLSMVKKCNKADIRIVFNRFAGLELSLIPLIVIIIIIIVENSESSWEGKALRSKNFHLSSSVVLWKGVLPYSYTNR